MDKTGTLTEGDFRVSVVESLSEKWSDEQILSIMAAMESNSSHPLAAGIMEEAKKRDVDYPVAKNVNVMNGTGLSGTVEGKEVKIVKASYLDNNNLTYNKDRFNDLAHKGNSVSYLIIDNDVAGLVAQGDEIKSEARSTIEGLKQMNLIPVMLTGDNEGYARSVASQIGISDIHAGLLPEDKEKVIVSYQKEGKPVMMAGDGGKGQEGIFLQRMRERAAQVDGQVPRLRRMDHFRRGDHRTGRNGGRRTGACQESGRGGGLETGSRG
jgi:Cu2+-exporting ATPase